MPQSGRWPLGDAILRRLLVEHQPTPSIHPTNSAIEAAGLDVSHVRFGAFLIAQRRVSDDCEREP